MAKKFWGARAHRPRLFSAPRARTRLARWSTLFSSRRPEHSPTGAPPLSLKNRVAALHSLPLLFHLLWVTSPRMTVANVLLRLVHAAVPLALLSLGKLIVNEVVRLRQVDGASALTYLWLLVAAECG